MFPYPSAAGLHVGHPEGYFATDIYCRYLRMKGFHVLHPMGFDSFGLPAENYAIKTGTHPRVSTEQNIARFTHPDQVPGLLLRLGPAHLLLRAGVLPLDAVDLPAPLGEGARLRGGGAHQLVPLVPHRARQRGGEGRPLRPLRHAGDAAQPAPVDPAHHRLRRTAPGRPGHAELVRVPEADADELDRPQRRGQRALHAGEGPTRTRSRSTRRVPTRSSAPPTWCSRPSIRSCRRSRTSAQKKAVDELRRRPPP